MQLTVDNVGSADADRHRVEQATCDGEDTFTSNRDGPPHREEHAADPRARGNRLTYTVVVADTTRSTTAHATLTDASPMVVAERGAGRRRRPVRAPRRRLRAPSPPGVALIAPGRHGDVPPSPRPYQDPTGRRSPTPPPQSGICGRQWTLQADDSFINPARLEVAKTLRAAGSYCVTVTNPGSRRRSGSGTFCDRLPDPPLDAAGATWACTAAAPGQRAGLPSGTGSPTGVAITVAPNGGTVTFAITVTILPSEVPVTVTNVGSVTPGPGTACVDGQPTCDGEDTFTSTPETAPITITKSQTPTTPCKVI